MRGRMIPEPWPMSPVRPPHEMEASLLDSDVQELFGPEELARDEVTSDLQLQWATQTEFPSVVRLFSLKSCAIALTAAGDGGAVAGPDLGSREAMSTCPSQMDRQELHILLIPARWYTEIAADLKGQLEIVSEVPEEIHPILTRRTATTYNVVGPNCTAWDERCSGVDEGCALSTPGSAEEEHASLSLPVAKARSAKRAAKRSALSGIAAPLPMRRCQAEFQATMLTHMEEFAGRLAALEVSEQPSATRGPPFP